MKQELLRYSCWNGAEFETITYCGSLGGRRKCKRYNAIDETLKRGMRDKNYSNAKYIHIFDKLYCRAREMYKNGELSLQESESIRSDCYWILEHYRERFYARENA